MDSLPANAPIREPLLRAVAEAVLLAPGLPTVAETGVVERVAGALAALPARQRLLLRGSLALVDATHRAAGRGAFADAPLGERVWWLGRLAASDVATIRTLVQLLKTPLLLAWVAHPDVRRALEGPP